MRAVAKLCAKPHRNIITVLQHGRFDPNSPIYFIDMELCDFNLHKYLQGTISAEGLAEWKSPKQDGELLLVCAIARQILSGVAFIHKHDEVHRDLNLLNGTF